MLLVRNEDVDRRAVKIIEGLDVEGNVGLKALMSGDHMVLLEIRYEAGSSSLVHSHSHESLCYIVSGTARATVGDQASIVGPGDVCRHPEGMPHSVEAIEDLVVVEIKSPVQDLQSFLGMG